MHRFPAEDRRKPENGGLDALLAAQRTSVQHHPQHKDVTAGCSTHQGGPQQYLVWGVVCPGSACRVLAVAQTPSL